MTLRRMFALTIATLAACLSLALATPAGAVENPSYTAPPPVQPIDSVPPSQVMGVQSVAQSRQRLPITGSDVTAFAVIGGLLVAGGAGVMVLRRRSSLA